MNPKPGLHRGISNEDYHAGPGIGSSGIRMILRSPAHYRYSEDEYKDCYRIGEAYHGHILEPDKFASRYAMMPLGLKRNGAFMPGVNNEYLKELGREVLASGNTVLTSSEYQTIKGMEAALWQYPKTHELLDSGEAELSGYFYHPDYPHILCKIRTDWLNKRIQAIPDLKSCTDAREEHFTRHADRLGYGIQAAWYLLGIREITGADHEFWFIAQEKAAPYAVKFYRANEELIVLGMESIDKAMATYAQCLESDTWPCYEDDVVELRPPAWKRNRTSYTPIFMEEL